MLQKSTINSCLFLNSVEGPDARKTACYDIDVEVVSLLYKINQMLLFLDCVQLSLRIYFTTSKIHLA